MDSTTSKRNGDRVKKPFDKKKWRERTYSHKYKVQKWEEKRKRTVLREYFKELKASEPKPTVTVQGESLDNIEQPKEKKKKLSAMKRAQIEMEHQKELKLEKKAEIEKQKVEREEKLQEYRRKKAERFKKLSKKTKKGQPIMKDRLEMLLEKIQRQCKNNE